MFCKRTFELIAQILTVDNWCEFPYDNVITVWCITQAWLLSVIVYLGFCPKLMANIPHKVSLLPTTWLFPCKYRSGAINRLKQSFFFFFFRFTVSIDCVFFFFVVALQAPYLLFFKSCTWSFLNFFFNVFFSFDFVDPHVTQYKSYLTWLIYEVKSETVKVLPIS